MSGQGGLLRAVIVGNGVAGVEAALTLRQRNPRASITLLSCEHPHFFSRTALMYILAGQLSLRDTEPHGRTFFQKQGMELRSGRAVGLEPGRLLLEGGGELGWDRLLIASGSVGRVAPWPGAEGVGVHRFVTLQDLEGLERALRPGGRAVVVGGGLIGVEVAEVLKLRGMRVDFVIREPWYFPVALDRREAKVVAEHIAGHGVGVHLGEEVDRLERDATGGLQAVHLKGGKRLEAELVVVAIGVQPNTAWLRSSGINLDPESGAIEVDAQLRSSMPGVWAAGDCARVAWIDGSRRPEQLWYTARDQGRVAGANMGGEDRSYRRIHWYNSAKFFDVEYTTAGFIPPEVNQGGLVGWQSWYQQVPGKAVTQRILVKEGRVVGFNMLGSRWDHEILLRWIQERRSLEEVLERLDEARFDEEFEPEFRVLPGAILESLEAPCK